MSDCLPACPRCGDLCPHGVDRCAACGSGLYVSAPARPRAKRAPRSNDPVQIGPLVSAELDRLLDAEIEHLLRDYYEGR